jgi:DNA polymerase-1
VKTIIIDMNNICFQALGKAPLFYKGQRTEVIKITLAMLRGYLERFAPDQMLCTWDGGRDERRKSIYPEYKRKKRDWTEAEKAERDILFTQMRQLVPVIQGLCLPQFKINYREGDDTIFTLLSQEWAPAGERIVISTDQDMFQLLHYFKDVRIFSPIKKLEIDADWVEQEFGIPITQFTFYKALVGDASDNIPGIRGIGPKKAVILIEEMGHAKSTKEGKKLLLQALKDEDELARQLTLVTLMTIPEDEMADGCICPGPTNELQEHVMRFAEQYGFDHILDHFENFVAPFEKMAMRAK